jgi:alpha-beta hydrolase superfamily lysophospholipase
MLKKWTIKFLAIATYASLGALLAFLVVFILYLNGRPDLSAWHTADLDAEFTHRSGVSSFIEYLQLEEGLFRQLDEEVYQQIEPHERSRLNRYNRGSLADPTGRDPDWNRSFEWAPGRPRAAILLLHGLSDSPYSMRAIGQQLHARGAHVLGLRIPGHGTAPSGLVRVTWQDQAAAVRLAVKHLAQQAPGQPIHLVGYSNGAALAVNYVLSSIANPDLPRVESVVLLSPEIGIAGAAAYAVWQARIGVVLGLDKLAWNDIKPEYDPYKYGSFAVNAADLAHRLTQQIQVKLTALDEAGKLDQAPPILAFTSLVDATVRAPALVENLFARLPGGGHRLVLFDINAMEGMESILNWSPDEWYAALANDEDRPFSMDLVTNESTGSRQVKLVTMSAGEDEQRVSPLGLEWPRDVFSLSHVALPFPPDDPLYGNLDRESEPLLHLGSLALRGERGVLHISGDDMLRLRWNPFYSFMEERILSFLQLEQDDNLR